MRIKNKKHIVGAMHYVDLIVRMCLLVLTFKYLNGSKRSEHTFDSSIIRDNTLTRIEYASVIDYKIYAMHCTRLEISFTVCRLSRYL